MLQPQSTALFLLLILAFVGFVWWMAVARQLALRVLAACLAFVPAMMFGVAAVNKYYDYYQSWGAVIADFSNQGINQSPLLPSLNNVTSQKFGSVLGGLVNPAVARQQGYTVRLTVYGRRSHLRRTVYIYLPPQYFQQPYAHYRFPVLELFHGFPGQPQDWINVLGINTSVNNLVRAGLARPAVLVMPDTNGSRGINMQCLNIPHGPQDSTFLATDVPAYVARTIRVQPPGRAWGLAGYSEGGYCAANLALHYPRTYGYSGVLSGYFSPLNNRLGYPPRSVRPFARIRGAAPVQFAGGVPAAAAAQHGRPAVLDRGRRSGQPGSRRVAGLSAAPAATAAAGTAGPGPGRRSHHVHLAGPARAHAGVDHAAAGLSRAAEHRRAGRRALAGSPAGLRLFAALLALVLRPAAEVAGEEPVGRGVEAQPVLRFRETVAFVREQQVLVLHSGRAHGRHDLL